MQNLKNNIIKERPILFSTSMVEAILAGYKTQTRRNVKARSWVVDVDNGVPYEMTEDDLQPITCPYGKVGDILWVRETWQETTWLHPSNEEFGYIYKASENGREWEANDPEWKWKPSLFMPRQACRLFLEITAIRAEKLCKLTLGDALAEGVDIFKNGHWYIVPVKITGQQKCTYQTDVPEWAFQQLWENINGSESWGVNPYVWVVEFKVLENYNQS